MTADNFKHNPPILQNKFEECDFETAGYRQWAANEQKREQLFVLVSKKNFIPFI